MKLKGIEFKHENGRLSKIVIDIKKAQTDPDSFELLNLLISKHNLDDDMPEPMPDEMGLGAVSSLRKMTVEELYQECLKSEKSGSISIEDFRKNIDKQIAKWKKG